MGLFKKKTVTKLYDKENKKPVIKASICNGEQVAGFKDIHTGKIEEVMLIKNQADLDAFKKNIVTKTYDKENKKPVIKASICNGEQVAGFKNIHTGKIEEVMLIKNRADLDAFKKMYGIDGEIEKEY